MRSKLTINEVGKIAETGMERNNIRQQRRYKSKLNDRKRKENLVITGASALVMAEWQEVEGLDNRQRGRESHNLLCISLILLTCFTIYMLEQYI